MIDTSDISSEAHRLARLIDRQPDGNYVLLIEKTSAKETPQLGWDVVVCPIINKQHVQMKRIIIVEGDSS